MLKRILLPTARVKNIVPHSIFTAESLLKNPIFIVSATTMIHWFIVLLCFLHYRILQFLHGCLRNAIFSFFQFSYLNVADILALLFGICHRTDNWESSNLHVFRSSYKSWVVRSALICWACFRKVVRRRPVTDTP